MLVQVLFFIALIGGGAAYAQSGASVEPYDRIVDVNGYRLFLKVQPGTQPELPTVILESGGGADSSQWSQLQATLSTQTGATVVSYDRPGFGKSDLPEEPYDIRDESRAFHEALDSLGLARNILLVGHSYGGFLIQLYASTWPATVRGLLFLDPNTPSFMLAAGAEGAPPPIRNPTSPRGRALARIDAAGMASYSAVFQAQLPLNIPVIVVSAETPPVDQPRLVRAFQLSHELLAASVHDGKRIIAEGSNHMITAQRPDLVVDAVKELLAKTP